MGATGTAHGPAAALQPARGGLAFCVRCAELQIQLTEAAATLSGQKELVAKLEHDLSTIQTLSAVHRPDAEGAAVPSLEKIPEPIKEATALFYAPPSQTTCSHPPHAVDSLLSIISSQRERFRARNQELEGENRMMQHTVQALQSELDNLRADNIKLYEKIKFLQSYPGRGSSRDDTELRYSSQYEERLDPFSSFSRKERQRKYLSLSPWDKATLSMGRLILSNKTARTIAFFYTLFLHCLVFLVRRPRAQVPRERGRGGHVAVRPGSAPPLLQRQDPAPGARFAAASLSASSDGGNASPPALARKSAASLRESRLQDTAPMSPSAQSSPSDVGKAR
ncbi:Protein CASP [Anas platyrhynchos]|uniref:Protein CASP n=1 Tax=Anas platyrhynchos TaxID=8839 RepID=R0KBU9_ANAPL|nr:Protein CASP [Anas platyrhynchos]